MSSGPNHSESNDEGLLDDVNQIVRSIAKTSDPLSEQNGSVVLGNRASFSAAEDKVVKKVEQEIRDYLGFMHRAEECRRQQEANQLITAVVTDQLENGTLPEIKKIVVADHSKKFLFSERHPPVEIPPGEHEVTRLGLGGGLGRSKQAFMNYSNSGAFKEKSKVLICDVRTGVFSTTIALPDSKGFFPTASRDLSGNSLKGYVNAFEKTGLNDQGKEHLAGELRRVLQEARLMTNDNVAVGVRIQLEIQVNNPEQIVANYFRYFTRQLAKEYEKKDKERAKELAETLNEKEEEASLPRNPGLLRGLGYTWKLLHQKFFGATQQSAPCPRPIAFYSIYDRHRLEFADAVRDAIRKESAKTLIENPAPVRERIITEIKEHMSSSLKSFGLEVSRIVSVECIAPEYNRLMSDRGRRVLRKEGAIDGFEQAAVEEVELQVETLRYQDQLRHQSERAEAAKRAEAEAAILGIRETSRVNDEEEALKLKTLQGEIERRRLEADYIRSQKLQDASDAIQVLEQNELKRLSVEDRQIDVQRKKIESHIQLDKAYRENVLRLEQQAKQDEYNREQDALNQAHHREQERIKTQFQHLLETRSAEMANRLQWLEKFAGISATTDEGKMLVMALACDPRLAKPYTEAVRAKSKDEMNAKLNEFKDQLVAVHGKQDSMVNELYQQGIKSIGQVLGKMSERPDLHTHYGSTWQVPPS